MNNKSERYFICIFPSGASGSSSVFLESIQLIAGMLKGQVMSLYSWRRWWSRKQGVRRYCIGWCTDPLGDLIWYPFNTFFLKWCFFPESVVYSLLLRQLQEARKVWLKTWLENIQLLNVSNKQDFIYIYIYMYIYTRSVNKVMRLAAYRTIWQNCGLALHLKVR